MFLGYRVGMGMDTLSPLQSDGDEGHIDGAGDANARAYFDSPFNTRLAESARDQVRGYFGSWRTHQSSRDSRVSDQKVCVRAARYTHKCAHLLAEPGLRMRPSGEVDSGLCGRPLIGL